MRNDNGGELCYAQFDHFCKGNATERHKKAPYTLKHNGVLDWMNRTLMERDMSILNGASLKNKFFKEVVSTTCHLINKSLTSTLVIQL